MKHIEFVLYIVEITPSDFVGNGEFIRKLTGSYQIRNSFSASSNAKFIMLKLNYLVHEIRISGIASCFLLRTK